MRTVASAGQILGWLRVRCFVHRNIANVVISDFNCLSVIGIRRPLSEDCYIIVSAGITAAAAVPTAMQNNQLEPDQTTGCSIRDVQQKHEEVLYRIEDKGYAGKTVRFNVIEQVHNVCRDDRAGRAGNGEPRRPTVWIYNLAVTC